MPYKQTKKYKILYFAPDPDLGPDIGAKQELRAAQIIDFQLKGMANFAARDNPRAAIKTSNFNNPKDIGTFEDLSNGSGISIRLTNFTGVFDDVFVSPESVIWSISPSDIYQDLFLGIKLTEEGIKPSGEIVSSLQVSSVIPVYSPNTSRTDVLFLAKRKAGLGFDLETIAPVLNAVAIHEADNQDPHGSVLQVNKLVVMGGLDIFEALGNLSGIQLVIEATDSILSSGIGITISTEPGLAVLDKMSCSGTITVDTLSINSPSAQGQIQSSGISEIAFDNLIAGAAQVDSLVVTSGEVTAESAAVYGTVQVSGVETTDNITFKQNISTIAGVQIDHIQFSQLQPLVNKSIVTTLHHHEVFSNIKRTLRAPAFEPVAIVDASGPLNPNNFLTGNLAHNFYRIDFTNTFAPVNLVTEIPVAKEYVTTLRALRAYVSSVSGNNLMTVFRSDGTVFKQLTIPNMDEDVWFSIDVDLRSGLGTIGDYLMVKFTAQPQEFEFNYKIAIGEIELQWE